MAVFTVHTPADGAAESVIAEKAVFLRDDFSFPAFVLGPVWLAWRRAFLPALAWVVLLGLVGYGGAKFGLHNGALAFINIALSAALGFEGPRLVAWSLQRKGLSENGLVVAESAEEAEEIYFHNLRRSKALSFPPGDASLEPAD